MSTERIVTDDEMLYCLATGLVDRREIGDLFDRSVGWAAEQLGRLYRRFNIPGKGSATKALVEAVRYGLSPPADDEWPEGLEAIRQALKAVLSGRIVLEVTAYTLFQSLANGFTAAEIGPRPELFDKDSEPLTAGAIVARIRVQVQKLKLQSSEQAVLVLLWARRLTLPPEPKLELELREAKMLLASIEGASLKEVARVCGLSVSSLRQVRAAVCGKLGVLDFPVAIMVAVHKRHIILPAWLDELAQQARSAPPASAVTASLADYIRNYVRHPFSLHPERAKSSRTTLGELLRQIDAPVPFSAIAVMTQAGLLTPAEFIETPPTPRLLVPHVKAVATRRPTLTQRVDFPDAVAVTVTGPEGTRVFITVGHLEQIITLGEFSPPRTQPAAAADEQPKAAEHDDSETIETEEIRQEEIEDAVDVPAEEEPAVTEPVAAEPVVPKLSAEDLIVAAIESAPVNLEAKLVLDEGTEALIASHGDMILRAAHNRQLRPPVALQSHLDDLLQEGLDPTIRSIIQMYADGVSGGKIDREYSRGSRSAKSLVVALAWRFKVRNYQTVVLFALWAGLVERHPDESTGDA